MLPDIGIDHCRVVRIVEGLFRQLCGGDAVLPVEVVIQGFRHKGHPVRFLHELVENGDVLAVHPQGVADAVEQPPAVQLVPGGAVAALPGKDPAQHFHGGNALFLPVAQPHRPLPGDAVHIIAAAADQVRAVCLRRSHKAFVHFRLDPVVAVHEAEVFAPGNVHASVPGAAEAPVFLVDDLNSGIFPGVFITNGAGGILGPVLHQNDFQVFIGLGQNRIDAFGKIRFHIVNRNDDADQGARHFATSR